MTKTEILENLCYYDKRNPLYIDLDNDIEKSEKCFCDNCFYGRNKLALEILKLKMEA
jgi:hypothetical protein